MKNQIAQIASYLSQNPAANFWICDGEIWHRAGARLVLVASFTGGDDYHTDAFRAIRLARESLGDPRAELVLPV
jgi:hypothetical protein